MRMQRMHVKWCNYDQLSHSSSKTHAAKTTMFDCIAGPWKWESFRLRVHLKVQWRSLVLKYFDYKYWFLALPGSWHLNITHPPLFYTAKTLDLTTQTLSQHDWHTTFEQGERSEGTSRTQVFQIVTVRNRYNSSWLGFKGQVIGCPQTIEFTKNGLERLPNMWTKTPKSCIHLWRSSRN